MKWFHAVLSVAVAAVVVLGIYSASDPVTSSAAMVSPTGSDAVQRDSAPASQVADKQRADEQRAKEVLSGFAGTYRYLEGVTVTVGTTPKGEQAVAYYTDGEIVIDKSHTETIERILAHEIWHVIDWRDNGRLDWGEDLPPHNSSDYFRN